MELCFVALLGWLLLAQAPVTPVGGPMILEDFERYAVGGPPVGEWESRGGDSKDEYSIKVEDGNHFLSAKDEGKSVQLFMKKGWDLKKFPILSWRWRARVLPEGADERHPKKNDSAAGVYVVFPRQWFIPETIKYVWSTTAPKDTEINKGKGFHIVVLRSGGRRAWKMANRVSKCCSGF